MGQRLSYTSDGIICAKCRDITKGIFVQVTRKVRAELGDGTSEIQTRDTQKLCVDCNKKMEKR